MALRRAIDQAGYYPNLVSDCLATALGRQQPTAFAVHHEATFDRDELRRHITVLALTENRLVVAHVDEHPPDEHSPRPTASASTEIVTLDRIHSVVLTRVIADPAEYSPGAQPVEVVLTVGWGSVRRLDLEPATCGDSSCDADHGYSGTSANDDLTVRMSEVADGADGVAQLLAFAAALSEATEGTVPAQF